MQTTTIPAWQDLKWVKSAFIGNDGKLVNYEFADIPFACIPHNDQRGFWYFLDDITIERYAKNTKFKFTVVRDPVDDLDSSDDYDDGVLLVRKHVIWKKLPNEQAASAGDALLQQFVAAIRQWLIDN